MTLLVVLLPAFFGGVLLCAFLTWPLAYRAGQRAERCDQNEIARILEGFDAPPPVREPIAWHPAPAALLPTPAAPALRAPTAAHASLRVATTPQSYVPRHGQLVRAHLAAAGLIGRPPLELVA